jgi:predicted RNA binding protein YcfA (HicA-like mRNA interferase family)
MNENPCDVRFADLCTICDKYFGEPRQKGSHRIYKTPWRGDPRINVKDDKGKAKPYRQVLKAIGRLEGRNGNQDCRGE